MPSQKCGQFTMAYRDARSFSAKRLTAIVVTFSRQRATACWSFAPLVLRRFDSHVVQLSNRGLMERSRGGNAADLASKSAIDSAPNIGITAGDTFASSSSSGSVPYGRSFPGDISRAGASTIFDFFASNKEKEVLLVQRQVAPAPSVARLLAGASAELSPSVGLTPSS